MSGDGNSLGDIGGRGKREFHISLPRPCVSLSRTAERSFEQFYTICAVLRMRSIRIRARSTKGLVKGVGGGRFV